MPLYAAIRAQAGRGVVPAGIRGVALSPALSGVTGIAAPVAALGLTENLAAHSKAPTLAVSAPAAVIAAASPHQALGLTAPRARTAEAPLGAMSLAQMLQEHPTLSLPSEMVSAMSPADAKNSASEIMDRILGIKTSKATASDSSDATVVAGEASMIGGPILSPSDRPNPVKDIKRAVLRINAYLDKEAKARLSQAEIGDLTTQFKYLLWLPDDGIPEQLLGHLEGIAIAMRDILKKNPAGRDIAAAVAAAEQLRAKVAAIPGGGKKNAASVGNAAAKLLEIQFSGRIPENSRMLLTEALAANASSVLPLVKAAMREYNSKHGKKARLKDMNLYAHYFYESGGDYTYQMLVEIKGQRIGVFVAHIDKNTHALVLGSNDD